MPSRREMVPRTLGNRRRSRRPPHVYINMPDVDDPPQLNPSSIPWYASFAVLIPAQLVIIQVHFQDSSPLHTHPVNMWTFLLCLFIYAFSLGYYIKLQISALPDTAYQELCFKVALISGSLASAALISMLVPHSFEPFVFIFCLIFLFIYFARNPIAHTCKSIVSYANNKWKWILEAIMTQQPPFHPRFSF